MGTRRHCRHPSARGVARCSKSSCAFSTFRFLCSVRLALEPLATIFIRLHELTYWILCPCRRKSDLMKIKSSKALLLLSSLTLLLLGMSMSWAEGGKGNLADYEIDYFDNTFYPILIKANVCKVAHGDCVNGRYVFCESFATLACRVYGITDEKIIKELFLSMLNSGLKVSSFTFYRSRYHEGSIWERPILSFTDRTGD